MQRSLLKAGRALEKTVESAVILVQFSAKLARAPCAIASRGAEKNRSGGRSGGGRPCRAWVRGVDGAVRTNSAMRAALSGAAGSRRRLLGARRETERITTQVCEGRNHRAVRFLSNPSRRSEYERSQSQRRESTFGARVLPRGWATWPHRRTRACKGRSTRPAGATRAAVRACGPIELGSQQPTRSAHLHDSHRLARSTRPVAMRRGQNE